MHNDRPVLAVLCLVDGEFACTVVAELVADTFAVHIREAVLQYPALVPVAPDAVTYGFAILV